MADKESLYALMKERTENDNGEEILAQIKSFTDLEDTSKWHENICIVSYLKDLFPLLQEHSCGKCVLCREGLWQLRLIMESISRGAGTAERYDFAKEISSAMECGCDCSYGKAVGRVVSAALEDHFEEIMAHIRKKQCPALACPAYYTLHILPDLCTGCEECTYECEDDAIEGRKGFIHIIDNDLCGKCEKCIEACEENAIVKAGSVKPRTPPKPVRCGTFKSRR